MSSIFGNSLRSPAPTSGAISKGRIPQTNVATRKRTLPSIQSLQNPSIRASVTDLQTNSTAAAPLFCRPFQKEWEKKYDEGDILFVKAEDVSVNSRNQFHVVANLPVLNQLLRETRDVGVGGIQGKRRYRADAEGFNNFKKDWHFFGVMLNDMDTGSQFQRLLNVTVRGRCRLPNYWSNDAGAAFGAFGGNRELKKGQVVWIGFIKHEIGAGGEVLFEPDGARKLVNETNPGRIGNEPYLQAIPVLEPDNWGGPASGTYARRGQVGGNKKFEECLHKIPIAVIHHLPFKNTPVKRQVKAQQVTDTGKLLDRMEVFVRI
tara:strand:+ start:29947 stop:30900 length:954 start_codon:yes stop_codon:yes gene_type:complete